MREGVALSIHGYNIVICFHTFMIFLNYFLFKCIVSLLTYYFYCHAFYTWASGSDDRGNPIPRIDVNKLIDWLIDWLSDSQQLERSITSSTKYSEKVTSSSDEMAVLQKL